MPASYCYVLNVLTKDHPGIIAALSSALGGLGGKVLSCSQTVLHGYFTFISIISVPENDDPETLIRKLRQQEFFGNDYLISVAKMEGSPVSQPPKSRTDGFVLTASGTGETEVVQRFSRYLADHDINIIDLFCDRTETDFVLIGQLEVPRHYDPQVLQDDLEEIGRELGMTIRMQHRNIFDATNRITGDW